MKDGPVRSCGVVYLRAVLVLGAGFSFAAGRFVLFLCFLFLGFDNGGAQCLRINFIKASWLPSVGRRLCFRSRSRQSR